MIKKISAIAAALTLTASAAGIIPIAGEANVLTASAAETNTQLPSKLDLTESPYFPAIDNQTHGDCGAFSTTWYQFTYEARKALFNKYNQYFDVTYSPSSTFNLLNKGLGNGVTPEDVYNLIKENGALTVDQFEYYDENHNGISERKLPRDAVELCKGLGVRVTKVNGKDFNCSTSDGTNRGVQLIKEMLNNDSPVVTVGDFWYGDYLNYYYDNNNKAVYYVKDEAKDWVKTRTNAKGEEEFVFTQALMNIYKDELDESGKRKLNGFGEGCHAFNIVGYDDDYEVEVNGKKLKGAFKIANSWGDWANSGCIWIMYDALNLTSAQGLTYDTQTYRRYGAFEWAGLSHNCYIYTIEAGLPDVKLISEADITSTNYYGLNVTTADYMKDKRKSLNFTDFYSAPDKCGNKKYGGAVFNGPIVTDITDMAEYGYIDGKEFKITVSNNDREAKFAVQSIALRDSLGNLVAKKELDFDSNDFVSSLISKDNRYKQNITASITLDLKRGDIDYDGDIDLDDLAMVKEYLAANDQLARDQFSSLQKDLMDTNLDGVIDEKDIIDEYFFTEDGKYDSEDGSVYTGWHLINNNYFYLDENGYKVTNRFIEDENKGETLFVGEDGREVVNRRFAFNGNQYCADQFGHIVKDREVVFYIYGINRTYYFDENGVQVVGWNADKTKYYTDAGMLTGTHTIEGVSYTFDENGVLVQD
jgi:hypothetical protein